MASVTPQGSFFDTADTGKQDFDPEKFLLEVDSQFQSEEIVSEVRWRLDVLREISSRPELEDVSTGLRDRLTQIFTTGGDEQTILQNLRALTEIQREGGEALDLRRFMQRERRTLGPEEYRRALERKIEKAEEES